MIAYRSVEKGHVDLWVSGLGEFSDQDGSSGISGFETDSYGFMAGVSYGVSDGVTVGALAGYHNLEQDFDSLAVDTDADNSFLGAYASASFGGLNIDTSFIYQTGDVDTLRSISALDATARGSYDVDTYVIHGRVGYEAFARDGWIIEPYTALTYIDSDRDQVVETGARGANLVVDQRSTDFTFLDLGARVTGSFADGRVSPYANLAWRYDLSNDPNDVTARFAGESVGFRVSGADVERSRFTIGSGLTGKITDKLSGYVSYDGEFGDDLSSHSIRTGLRYSF